MNLNFSENFKQLRKEKGDTQEKLGEIFGVTGQTISRWELGICYPDLELLPSIANYFDVTVDALLSNDANAKKNDREYFYEQLKTLYCEDSTEQIDFVRGYCQKYPNNDEYAYKLVHSICNYAAGNDERTAKYMPLALKTAERLLDTQYRYATIQRMVTIIPESELDKWLSMAPYSGFSRRNCLITRAVARDKDEQSHIQKGLGKIETFAGELDLRCPDAFGAEKKAEFQREVLQVVESFGVGREVPDGWKMFYAYKQLVLSACLFGQKKYDEGWKEFDSAIEKCKYVMSLKEEWLDIGGSLFANLKVSKDWKYAIDQNGNKHKLFAIAWLSFYSMNIINNLLTDSRWAWFDSVRDTEKFKEVVAWVQEMRDKLKNQR
ncbi:MAG: helix-turn-helix transcriptional regulator [Ruminococcaceae bacterium]|nr:helix-turn-helix transcriptional regulator [Oscillospiraceae bacterium]